MFDFLTESAFYVGVFAATIRLAAPLLYAAIGETVAERAGVLNIGLEGMMLGGAWSAFMITFYSGSGWVGLASAAAVGMGMGAVLAYLCVSRAANQMITGLVINLFALGFTSFIFRETFSLKLPTIAKFESVNIPYLSDVSQIGPIFFQHTWIVYIAFLLVPVSAFILYKTHFGLAVRAAGEVPEAVDATGISVQRIRYVAAMIGGAFAGLGGAALSVGQLSQFSDNLTAGRGFIALAIVLLGRWDPIKVLVATLLFAFADALQLRLQVEDLGAPNEFLQMIPYVLAIIMMTGFLGRARPPRNLAVPYSKS